MDYVMLGAVAGQSVNVLLYIVGVLGAIAFAIWKVIIPTAKWITIINEKVVPNFEYMPLLAELQPILATMRDIAQQFTPDSGESLKDATDRLESYAVDNRTSAAAAREAAEEARMAAAQALEAAKEWARTNADGISKLRILVGTLGEHAKDDRDLARTDRDLARDDREIAHRALEQILDLVASAERADESRARTEASGVRIEAASAHVAEDLAAKQQRADEVQSDEPPGTAADAASQSPEGADEER
jgi:hypothetical protein